MSKNSTVERITVDIKQLTEMLSVGRNTALAIAEEAGAGIKFGRRKLYNGRLEICYYQFHGEKV